MYSKEEVYFLYEKKRKRYRFSDIDPQSVVVTDMCKY